VFAVDYAALVFIAALGVAMSVAGALWVAAAVGRIEVAEALRDRAIDLPATSGSVRLAIALAVVGIPLLFVPPIAGLPLGGYAAIALWLGASVLAVAPLCRAILGRVAPSQPVAALAFAQVRHLPGHLAASVAGIVVSASLCVAMAIMVFSFRVSLEDWLAGVIGADLYVRSSNGDTGFFSDEEQRRVAALPEIAASEPLRYDRIVLDPGSPPLTLVARPIKRSHPRGVPGGAAGDAAEGGRDPRLDFGSGARPARLEGRRSHRDPDRGKAHAAARRGNDSRLRAHVGFGADAGRGLPAAHGRDARSRPCDPPRARRSRQGGGSRNPRALPQASGAVFEDAADLRRRSLQIFDRSFAVTYALEAIAVIIGLAGITSSFAALAWSRRREFGVLRFLGLTRRDVLRMLALEGAATGALGALIGLASGIAISLVLIHVVNRQSFHWTLNVHWPIAALAALVAAIVILCAFGARVSAALAVRSEAILAVKDDA